MVKWDKIFKNGLSKTCGRQPLKNFIWSILEYFVPNGTKAEVCCCASNIVPAFVALHLLLKRSKTL